MPRDHRGKDTLFLKSKKCDTRYILKIREINRNEIKEQKIFSRDRKILKQISQVTLVGYKTNALFHLVHFRILQLINHIGKVGLIAAVLKI